MQKRCISPSFSEKYPHLCSTVTSSCSIRDSILFPQQLQYTAVFSSPQDFPPYYKVTPPVLSADLCLCPSGTESSFSGHNLRKCFFIISRDLRPAYRKCLSNQILRPHNHGVFFGIVIKIFPDSNSAEAQLFIQMDRGCITHPNLQRVTQNPARFSKLHQLLKHP